MLDQQYQINQDLKLILENLKKNTKNRTLWYIYPINIQTPKLLLFDFFYNYCCKKKYNQKNNWIKYIYYKIKYLCSSIFTELVPLGRFSHTVAMFICVSVRLLQFKTPSSGGHEDLWSDGLSLILVCNDTIFSSSLFQWFFFALFNFFRFSDFLWTPPQYFIFWC